MKKLFQTFLILILSYALIGIPTSFANTISPAINEVKLPQGQRSISSVSFFNEENRDIQILLSVYEYDPKTEKIIKDSNNIFLKVDTDTFAVKAKSKQEIPYEIYPQSNLELGTYFNALVLTKVENSNDVYINEGISQLVVLHLTDPDQSVKGITTDSYLARIDITNKGIPFILPAEIKYTITNNSNYVITPSGKIEVFNKRNNYKPEYIYINKEKRKIYPKESIEETYKIEKWNISDIFSERVVIGNFYNGLDNNPKVVETKIDSYIYEFIGLLGIFILIPIVIKSIKGNRTKKVS